MDIARILHPTSVPVNHNPRSRTPKRPTVSRSVPSASTSTYHRHSSASADIPTLPSQRLATPPPARYLASQPDPQPSLPRHEEAEVIPLAEERPPIRQPWTRWDFEPLSSSEHGGDDNYSEYTLGEDDLDDFDALFDQELDRLRTPPRTTSQSPIDLTLESSPEMPRNYPTSTRRSARTAASSTRDQTEQRKRDTRTESVDLTGAGPSKRRRLSGSAVGVSGVNRVEQQPSQNPDITAIDLSGADEDLQAVLAKQRADAVTAQQKIMGQETKLNALTCTVCLDSVTDLTATSCGHAFCRKCLTEWLQAGEREHPKRSTCPACRKTLKMKGRTLDVIPYVQPLEQSGCSPALANDSRQSRNNEATVECAAAQPFDSSHAESHLISRGSLPSKDDSSNLE